MSRTTAARQPLQTAQARAQIPARRRTRSAPSVALGVTAHTVRFVPAPNVQPVLLRAASVAMIDEAMAAVADAMPNPEKLHQAFLDRRTAMLAGELPDALWLLRDDTGCIGWAGWAPYAERPDAWQTTTYFSPAYRGSGLFERARCLELHAADTVTAWAQARSRPVTFLLSIADWNTRSLRASRRYAAECGWHDTWEQVQEPHAGRLAHVFLFPPLPAPHRCWLASS